jgi:hypothetical protein
MCVVADPTVADLTKLSLPVQREQLTELSCDRILTESFLIRLYEFWLHVTIEYPVFANEAMSVLLSCSITDTFQQCEPFICGYEGLSIPLASDPS